MKVDFDEFAGFSFIPEDGRDILWLRAFVENVGSTMNIPVLSEYFVFEGEHYDEIEWEKVDDAFANEEVKRLRFHPFGTLASPFDFLRVVDIYRKQKDGMKKWITNHKSKGTRLDAAEEWDKYFPDELIQTRAGEDKKVFSGDEIVKLFDPTEYIGCKVRCKSYSGTCEGIIVERLNGCSSKTSKNYVYIKSLIQGGGNGYNLSDLEKIELTE